MGDWTLTFTGTSGDSVIVDLLGTYDLQLVLDLPRGGVGEAAFEWRLEDGNGDDITDQYLLANLSPVLHLTDSAGNTQTIPFPAGVTDALFQMDAEIYTAHLQLNDHGIVRTSNTQQFQVLAAPPVPPITLFSDAHSITLMTIFNSSGEVFLGEVANFRADNRPLSVNIENVMWQDTVIWDFEAHRETININANNTGNAELRVIITDALDNEVVLFVNVRVISGLIPIIIGAVLLLIAGGVIVFIKMANKPHINDPMSTLRIKMSLPPSVGYDYPPETHLTLPRAKGRRTLRSIINDNISIAEPYRAAFEYISWFADGTTIGAVNKNIIDIKTAPPIPGYTIKIGNQTGITNAQFDRNGGTEIRIGFDTGGSYDEYVLTLGNVNDMGGGNSFQDFGGGFNQGGFNQGGFQDFGGGFTPPGPSGGGFTPPTPGGFTPQGQGGFTPPAPGGFTPPQTPGGFVPPQGPGANNQQGTKPGGYW